MSKLMNRVLIGLLGIPILLIFIFANQYVILAFSLFLATLAYKEGVFLAKDKFISWPYLLGLLTIYSFVIPPRDELLRLVFNPGLGVFTGLILISYNILKSTNFEKTSYYFFLLSYLSVGFWSFNEIFYYNRWVAIFTVLLIWTFDSCQYFVGRKIGKTKLFKVSPNKSIEGLIGGAILVSIFYIIYFIIFKQLYIMLPNMQNVSIIYSDFFTSDSILFLVKNFFKIIFSVIVFGIFGDLLISQIKRTYKVKDSSNILGEHGGFLDRLDSIISVSICVNVLLFFY